MPCVAEAVLTEARRLPEAHKLRLSWSDGYAAELDYDYLRGWCPCAGCQGHVGEPRFRPVSQPVDLLEIQPVGNYAITFRWSDGHETGIYRYDFLRQISSLTADEGSDTDSP